LRWPWSIAALERYKMRHTSYGDLQGRFESNRLGAVQARLVAVAAGVAVVVRPDPAALHLWGVQSDRMALVWVGGIRFGDVRFDSNLTAGRLFGLYWKVIGWSLLLGFILSLWVGAVAGIAYVGGAAGTDATENVHDLAAASRSVRHRPRLRRPGACYRSRPPHLPDPRSVAAGRRLGDNPQSVAADNVTARGDLVSALGEGFADSLDVVGF